MTGASKIFSVPQIRQADADTIRYEPVSSIDLMERAAGACAGWIKNHFSREEHFVIVCGPGNNGGDGLAIARLLYGAGYPVQVYTIEHSKYTEDFLLNRERLQNSVPSILTQLSSVDELSITHKDIVIDAIFGTGLSKPVSGLARDVIQYINNSKTRVITIDIPSGLSADQFTGSSACVCRADHTLSFQFPKLAFFFPSNADRVGEWEVLDIGLSSTFIKKEKTSCYYLTKEFIRSLQKTRTKFSHKGIYGHALIMAGSHGKIGAAILSVKACLRSGVGLVTAHIPSCGYTIMQSINPEAMVSSDSGENFICDNIATEKYTAIGIGPGIDTKEQTQQALYALMNAANKPLVLDADALNILGLHKEWLDTIPHNSILTPHPKEFERIAGESANDFERHAQQLAFSKKYKVYIVLKGAHTCITTPDGDAYFNTTGNPGMAKGGSGDILTGIITGLLAQQYSPLEASLIGVFVHGLAGDLTRNALGEIGMTATDICDHLPQAFMHLFQGN